jgi:hypothetical protein
VCMGYWANVGGVVVNFGLKPEEEEWRFGSRYALGARLPG